MTPSAHARGRIQIAITAATIGSIGSHPAVATTTAATITPTEPAASAIASMYALSIARLSLRAGAQHARTRRCSRPARGSRPRASGRPSTSRSPSIEAEHGFDQHVDRDREEQHRVDERREDLEPEQPEGARPRRGDARLATTIAPSVSAMLTRVGRHVGGVGEQRQRVGDERGDASTTTNTAVSTKANQSRPDVLGRGAAHGVGVVVRAPRGRGNRRSPGILAARGDGRRPERP